MGMGNLLTTLGEEVGNMLISCPDIPHIFSVHHRVSSTEYFREEAKNVNECSLFSHSRNRTRGLV